MAPSAPPADAWKAFFLCEPTVKEQAPGARGIETDGAAFFALDALPELSVWRVTGGAARSLLRAPCAPRVADGLRLT